MKANYTGSVADNVIHIPPPDPYATLGQQIRAELDREAEAVAYLEARGYKVIKKEGV